MSSQRLDIADAVTAVITGGSWSQTVTATRSNFKEIESEEEGTGVLFTVRPGTFETVENDGVTQRAITVDIEIRKKLTSLADPLSNTNTDGLFALSEEIGRAFEFQPLTGYTSAACMGFDVIPIPELAWDGQVFAELLTLAFVVDIYL